MFEDKICFTKNQAYEFLKSFGYRPTFICSDKQVGALIENDMLQGGTGFFIVWNGFMIDGIKSSFKFTIFDVVADHSDIFQLEPQKFVLRSLRKIRYLKKNEDPRDIAAKITKELNDYRVHYYNLEINSALDALEG